MPMSALPSGAQCAHGSPVSPPPQVRDLAAIALVGPRRRLCSAGSTYLKRGNGRVDVGRNALVLTLAADRESSTASQYLLASIVAEGPSSRWRAPSPAMSSLRRCQRGIAAAPSSKLLSLSSPLAPCLHELIVGGEHDAPSCCAVDGVAIAGLGAGVWGGSEQLATARCAQPQHDNSLVGTCKSPTSCP